MPRIGTFTREATGFVGRIQTFTLDRDVTLVPAEPSVTDNAPDYRIHHGDEDGPEIGVGWKRAGNRASGFIALVIDDPAFAQPIRAYLFRDDEGGATWSLHWSRSRNRDGKD